MGYGTIYSTVQRGGYVHPVARSRNIISRQRHFSRILRDKSHAGRKFLSIIPFDRVIVPVLIG